MYKFIAKFSYNTTLLIKKYSVLIILLFFSFIAISTHLIIGFPKTHSVIFNMFWEQSFTEQVLAGEIYPRWLFNQHDGFGSPAFYFYAPMPFYLFSFIEVIFGNNSEGFATLTIGHMMIFFLSSVAFFVFISRYIDKFWAVVTSILYIFVPYHYIDLEVRGAVGESLAYVWIPLIMAGLCCSKKTWTKLFLSGICYAGLILSHLPSALLCALPIAIFSACVTPKPRLLRATGYAVFIGMVGVAVSAIYMLPALLLRNTLPHDAWVAGAGPHFNVTNWLIGIPDIHPFGVKAYIALAVTSLLAVGLTFVFSTIYFKTKRHIETGEMFWPLIIACLLTIAVCWFFMTNLSRPIWAHCSILAQIQFPWRLGVIIDFCSILLVALAIPHVLAYLLSLLSIKGKQLVIIKYLIATTAIAIASIAIVIAAENFPHRSRVSPTNQVKRKWSIEYRTKWLVESDVYLPEKNYDDLANINIARQTHIAGFDRWMSFVNPLPPIASLRTLKRSETITIQENKIGSTSIFATLKVPATIRVKKVYYPHWRLTDESGEDFNVYADTQTGLLAFDLSPGEYELLLNRRLLPVEQVGFLISLASIIVIVVCVATFGRREV